MSDPTLFQGATSTLTAGSILRNVNEATSFHRDVQLTGLINTLAGNAANQGWPAARHQLPIMTEEWNELCQGIADGNAAAVRDGAADLLFTLIGFCHRTGIDLLGDFGAVVKSNFTKVDHSSYHAMLTRDKYLALGITTINRMVELDGRTYWVTLVDGDQIDTKGKRYPHGKWLKSINFEDVNFATLPEDNALNLPTTRCPPDEDPATTDLDQFSVSDLARVLHSAREEVHRTQGYALPTVADNDADMSVPLEPTAVDAHDPAIATIPTVIAVNELLAILRSVPSASAAMEEFLSYNAYLELMAVSADGYSHSGPANAATASTAAITGAQRFLTILLIPHKYMAELHPYRYATIRADDVRYAYHQLTHILQSVQPADRAVLLRCVRQIGEALADDKDYQLTWHANLMMAWKDSAVPHDLALRIANRIFKELFNVDATGLYDAT